VSKKYTDVINEAIVCHQQGDNVKAYGMMQKLLKKRPKDLDALHFAGVFAYHGKQTEDAMANLRKRVMTPTPKHAYFHHHISDTYYFYAIMLYDEKKPAEVIKYCKKALEHVGTPKDVRARVQSLLGRVYLDFQRYDEAKIHLDKAIEVRSQCPTTWELMGKYYERTFRLDKSLEAFQKAHLYDPTQETALCSLALLQKRLGMMEQSRDSFQRLFEKNMSYGTCIEMGLSLPSFYNSVDEMEAYRTNYAQQLLQFLDTPMPIFEPMDAIHTSLNFQLAYHGKNDRDIQAGLGQLFNKCLDMDDYVPHKPHQKIRIGFVSKFMNDKHTIGKLNNELIRRLPRDIFDVYVFHVMYDYHHKTHGGRFELDNGDIGMYIPIDSTQLSSRLIRNCEIDAMFYTDIGMDPMSYFLAYHRLAPVQCVTWGHPVTTGIPNMDYFISSHLIESDNSIEHYTENLVLLDTPPTFYKKPMAPSKEYTKADFEGTEEETFYTCPQSCFKFHPEYDVILADILRRDPAGKLVLIRDYSAYGQERLMSRFEKNFGELMERVIVLDRMKRDEFLGLMKVSDVLLDPLHFGGGNTTYEGLAMGTPIVTLPGEFMRGRVTLGCFKKMNVFDTVVDTKEAYVDKAIQLGTDPFYRDAVHQKIMSTHHVLYEDETVIEQMTEFFQQAVALSRQESV
jgi:predicted O-linked N-acetylglucosamine transferase (SPINDLY family)